MCRETAVDKATALNNAGVYCLQARKAQMAWDLFKGALEVKLAIASHRSGVSKTSPVSNDYIRRAEVHLDRFEKDCSPHPSVSSTGFGEVITSGSSSPGSPIDVWYEPFLCARPFFIPDRASINDCSSLNDLRFDQCANAAIIFNLALIDHIHNRKSAHAISLYKLATKLMVDNKKKPLGIALINNIGVWNFENGDIDAAQRCMNHLLRILRGKFTEENSCQQKGLLSNIMWVLNPPCTASAAA